MKLPVISKKDSYIYKISKEIHKGMKIISNPLKKLAGHCIEHKINRRNDEGCHPLSHSFLAACFLSFHLLVLCSISGLHGLYRIWAKRCRETRPGELNSLRWVACLMLKVLTHPGKLHSHRRVPCLGLKKLH